MLLLSTGKKKVRKGGLVCRLNYEEKRLYIHEIGGGGDVDNDDCYVIATRSTPPV